MGFSCTTASQDFALSDSCAGVGTSLWFLLRGLDDAFVFAASSVALGFSSVVAFLSYKPYFIISL